MNNCRKANRFLAAGILCHVTAFALFACQKQITSCAPFKQFVLWLTGIADFLWSLPSALLILFMLVFTPWLYYTFKVKRKRISFSDWFNHSSLPSFLKISLLALFFIFTLFPLRWAQLSFTRSPESFPDYTPFGFILILLSVVGVIFYCLYCFSNLPSVIVGCIDNLRSRFFKWKDTYFIGSLLILCFVTTAIIAYTVLDHIPHVLDSIAQLFHAKIFKMGKLYASLPPQKEFFDYTHVINDTRWYSQYPPGHTLLLMLGLFLGVPWLIGPLVGTLSLFIFYRLVKEIYRDHQTTYLSSLFLFLSPFFLFMSSSHMNHNSTLFFMLFFLYCYQRTFSSHSLVYPLMSGLALGYAINIRPLTAAAVSVPFIFNLVFSSYKKRNIQTKKLILFFMCLSIMIALLLVFNDRTNGNPFLFGYQKKYQTLGFVGHAQGGPPHTLKGGVINTSNNLIGLNQYLFEWPIPSLIFIFILFSFPIRKNRWDWLFLYSSLSLIASHFFYYHQDYIYGPRFYYSLTPFLIVLTVRGFLGIPGWLETSAFQRGKTRASLYLLVVLCFFYAFSVSFPALIKKYSDDYWWVTDKLHKMVRKQEITNAIIFMDCWHPVDNPVPRLIYYGSGFQFNSPDLKDDVIYALDLKEKNIELMEAFPDRSYYVCNFFWDRNTIAW